MNDEVPIWSCNMLQVGVSNFWQGNLVVSNGLWNGCGIYSAGIPLATVGPLPIDWEERSGRRQSCFPFLMQKKLF